jgi:hypothetical protein
MGNILQGRIAMMTRRLLWFLLPLLLVACSEDNATVEPPVTLTPEEQQIASDANAIRDVLETYAAANGGSYGQYEINPTQVGITDLGLTNPYTGERNPGGFAFFPGEIGVESYVSCDDDYAVLGYRITGFGRDHQLIVLQNVDHVPADVRNDHDVTVATALLVRETAMRWAAANGSTVPEDVDGGLGVDGKTLKDYLPNGELLVNPMDGTQSNPQDGVGQGTGGVVGYLPGDYGGGDLDNFVIEAYECSGAIMLTLVGYSSNYDEFVNSDSHGLRNALERFKNAAGAYPHDLATETTPGGKTVFDLFFEYDSGPAEDFVNPYTKEHYLPAIGTATKKGEISCQLIETNGVVTDYVVTGRGLFEEIAHLGPWPLP